MLGLRRAAAGGVIRAWDRWSKTGWRDFHLRLQVRLVLQPDFVTCGAGVWMNPAMGDRRRLRGRGPGPGQGWGGRAIAVRLVLAAIGQAAMVSGSTDRVRDPQPRLACGFGPPDKSAAPSRSCGTSLTRCSTW
jgi:hypothetical protein